MDDVDIRLEGEVAAPWLNSYKDFVEELLVRRRLGNGEFSITLCDRCFMRRLNKAYRNQDCSTDVLAFAQDEPREQKEWIAGDIVISLDDLEESSCVFGVSQGEELKRLTVHGVLHLEGWNHKSHLIEEETMLRIQEKILEDMADIKVWS